VEAFTSPTVHVEKKAKKKERRKKIMLMQCAQRKTTPPICGGIIRPRPLLTPSRRWHPPCRPIITDVRILSGGEENI
jgi:hypothetical protein